MRLASLATALGLITAAVSMGSASAATPGVGTSQVSTTVAQLNLGDLLSAQLLNDASASSIDPSRGTPEAATVLRPLKITSDVIDALNVELPEVAVRTTGAENRQEVTAIDLDTLLKDKLPAALDGAVGSLVSGEVSPASLAAIVDAAGARSGLESALGNVSAGGGLVSLDGAEGGNGVALDLATDAAKEVTQGTRSLNVGNIDAVNLGALLDGLGLPLTDLNVEMVTGLVDGLGLLDTSAVTNLLAQVEAASGLALPDVSDAADLEGVIGQVTDADTDAIADLEVCETAGDTLGELTGGLPVTGPISELPDVDAGTLCADALDDLLAALPSADLLGGLLGILDGVSLLSLDGVTAGVVAKATDSVSTSSASVTAAVGAIRVGDLAEIPGIDLLATAADLANKADAVTSQVDSVLGLIGIDAVGDLAGILDVSVLDTTGTGVSKNGEYVQSVANLTGLKVTITPPANLAAIIGAVTNNANGLSVLEELAGVTGGTPAEAEGALTMPHTEAMRTLENALTVPGTAALAPAGVTNALAGGATLSLASIGSTSNFVPRVAGQATPTPTGGELPRTGTSGQAAGLAALGMLFGALAFGIRRQVLAPVRIDK